VGDRRYSSTILSALDGSEWSVSGPGQCTSKKEHLTTIGYEAGGPQIQSGRCEVEKNLFPARSRTLAVEPRSVAVPPSELSRLLCTYLKEDTF
jgi:hypothetical protein